MRSDSAAVAVATPRLSWTVASDDPGWIQQWAELRRGDEVRRIDGRASVLADWPFAPLAAGERAHVEVRAASTKGTVTPWSSPLQVWAAFAAEWTARPIALADPRGIAQPALLRREFTVGAGLARATLHWTALGVVDLVLDGAPVGDAVMTPGWTSYRERLVYETADVTDILAAGPHALGALLAGGWYTEGYQVLTAPKRFYGDQPRFAGQLVLEYADGSREVVATDPSWRAAAGPILSSGVYDGEHVDARLTPHGWDRSGFDDSAWAPAVVTGEPLRGLEARDAPPVRRTGSRTAQSVTRTPSGRILLDFGQNLVGRLRLRVSGAAGTTITVRHAEVLQDGELALRPLKSAKATDSFTLAGDGVEEFEPRFTFHGFRYADIDGWPGEFDADAVEAVILGSDLERTGWFSSSDDLLNRLHENVVWTERGNYLAVPQDCPQRDERLGWTGDTQLFAPTAQFLFDTHAFLRSWLRDLRIEQDRLGGVVPLFAPDVLPDFADRGPMAAWGDAIAIVPDVLARSSGDRELLAEFYPGMRAWLEVVLAEADDEGLWTSGRQLGDWLDPNAPPNAPSRTRTDSDVVATAYLARTAQLTADIAETLGEDADAARFAAAAASARLAFTDAFVTPSGRMMCDTQTAYAVAIAFDLIEDAELRRLVGDRLAFAVRRDGHHIATGLVGTAVLMQALTAAGHLDTAERLLFQTESPSWLYPVTVGATTVWERWDGLREDGSLNPGAMISFNHVAFGAVAEWLHTTVAGLEPDEPGYRRIRIAPTPLRRLSHAQARHLTPYGHASAGWERATDGVRVFAEVPPNTTAVVALPDGRRTEVGSGTHEWLCPEAPASDPAPVDLESSMADLADDPAAYRAFHAALAAQPNRFLAAGVRANALYTPGRSIRDALIFADDAALAAVSAALATTHPNPGGTP
nr:alpha-L-rhamnosidase [Microbacterium thalassium]